MSDHFSSTVLQSMKLTYDAGSIHDRWFMVLWKDGRECHNTVLPARTRDGAISYVQDRLQALKINGSGSWAAWELGFGPWQLSSTMQSRFGSDFWTPDMFVRAEAATLDSRAKITAAFDREIQRLDTLQQQFIQWSRQGDGNSRS